MNKQRLADMPLDKPDVNLLWHNAIETASRLLGALRTHDLEAAELAADEVSAEIREIYMAINH